MKGYSFLFFLIYLVLLYVSKKRIDTKVNSLSDPQKECFFNVSKEIKKKYRSVSLCLIAMLLCFVILFDKYSIYGYLLFFFLCLIYNIIYLSYMLRRMKTCQLPKSLSRIVVKANLVTIISLSIFMVSVAVIKL